MNPISIHDLPQRFPQDNPDPDCHQCNDSGFVLTEGEDGRLYSERCVICREEPKQVKEREIPDGLR